MSVSIWRANSVVCSRRVPAGARKLIVNAPGVSLRKELGAKQWVHRQAGNKQQAHAADNRQLVVEGNTEPSFVAMGEFVVTATEAGEEASAGLLWTGLPRR